MVRTAILLLALTTGAPALAAGGVPPLPLGGDAVRIDLGITGPFAFGPAFRGSTTAPQPFESREHGLAAGGFLEYALDAFRFGGSVMGGAGLGRAELTAGYVAGDTSLTVHLGSEWGDGQAFHFSPNPVRYGGELAPSGDVDVGFTVRHALAPNLYVSGTAAAAQSERPADHERRARYLFGASIGLKF